MRTPNPEAGDIPEDHLGAALPSEQETADLWRPDILAEPWQLTRLRDEITAWAARAGLPPDRISDLQLAVYEAMANVVVHAYLGAVGTLSVRAHSHGEGLTVIVTDHGEWQPAARPGPLHGRGLPLIRGLSDHAAVVTGATGTTVTMGWNRTGSG